MKLFISSIFFLLTISVEALPTVNFDSELWEHIYRISESSYVANVKEAGGYIEDYNGWKKPIETTFRRLAHYSNQPDFVLVYAVIKNSNFNASAYPGGQFIIHTGTLDYLDQIIVHGDKKLSNAERDRQREVLIAGILSHELSHYYNRHTFNFFKKALSYGNQIDSKIDLQLVKFSQELEADADRSGYLLLQRAGYNPDIIVWTLEILNNLNQSQLRAESASTDRTIGSIPYFQTHPSPHERLARIKGENQQWHKWAAKMEKTFADIQLGIKLQVALREIQSSLSVLPENVDLLKAEAVCLHKLWMQSASLSELKLKPVIDMPSFRDEMISSATDTTKGKKQIPGNKDLFFKAAKAYRTVFQMSPDSYLASNYAVLLVYSDKAEDENDAIELAISAFKITPSFSLANNVGLVLYISGNESEAYNYFSKLTNEVDKNLETIISQAETDKESEKYLIYLKDEVRKKQSMDKSYVFEDFTVVLNFALVGQYLKTQESNGVVSKYLMNYDSSSDWSKYLSRISGIKIPKPNSSSSQTLSVNGLKVGDTIKSLLDKWGKATRKDSFDDGEIWTYENLATRVKIDGLTIVQIELLNETSPKINKSFGIGDRITDAEKVLGQSFKRHENYLLYQNPGNAAVSSRDGIITSIVLY